MNELWNLMDYSIGGLVGTYIYIHMPTYLAIKSVGYLGVVR